MSDFPQTTECFSPTWSNAKDKINICQCLFNLLVPLVPRRKSAAALAVAGDGQHATGLERRKKVDIIKISGCALLLIPEQSLMLVFSLCRNLLVSVSPLLVCKLSYSLMAVRESLWKWSRSSAAEHGIAEEYCKEQTDVVTYSVYCAKSVGCENSEMELGNLTILSKIGCL